MINENLFEVVLEHNSRTKHLFTLADSEEEAGQKFNRYITCQWIGYPWDGPETLLEGTFDRIIDGVMI